MPNSKLYIRWSQPLRNRNEFSTRREKKSCNKIKFEDKNENSMVLSVDYSYCYYYWNWKTVSMYRCRCWRSLFFSTAIFFTTISPLFYVNTFRTAHENRRVLILHETIETQKIIKRQFSIRFCWASNLVRNWQIYTDLISGKCTLYLIVQVKYHSSSTQLNHSRRRTRLRIVK